MPPRKSHVFYVTRPSAYDTGCGHQHATPSQARNCAINMLARNKTWPHVIVVRIRHGVVDPERVNEKILEEVKQTSGLATATAT